MRVSNNLNTMFTGMCLCFLKYGSSIALARVTCCTNTVCEYFKFPWRLNAIPKYLKPFTSCSKQSL